MANGHGGKRPNSGRKSFAEEAGLQRLLNECVTVDERKALIEELKTQAIKRHNLRAIELLLAYMYGKPTQRNEIVLPKAPEEMTDDELDSTLSRIR